MTHTDTTLSALLAAIVANPDDMTARLAYADRLEECGDVARAEFARVQMRLSEMNYHPACDHRYRPPTSPPLPKPACPGCRYRKELKRLRSQEIVFFNQVEFPILRPNGPIHGLRLTEGSLQNCDLPIKALVRRGFPEIISCTCADWHTHGPSIVTQTPVREVRLVDREPAQFQGIPAFWRENNIAYMPHDVPKDIFRHLTGFREGDSFVRYDSWKNALDDLSRACIQWARDAAKLPRWEG